MSELFNFLKGYVIIKVKGNFPEKFLNLALMKKIYIWDIRKVDRDVVTMKMSTKGFLLLKDISRRSNCRVTVIAKKGLFFKLRNIRHIKAFSIGLIVFFLTVKINSLLITDIRIEGNENIPTSQIEKLLYDCGLKRWMFKNSLDIEQTERQARIENKDLSFLAINLNGTIAYVQVAEAIDKPEIVDRDTPFNIVASKDGVIETIRVKTGFQVAHSGDTVKKGDLLVSGITDSRFLTVRYVNSDAEIKLRAWQDYVKEFPLKIEERTKTGQTELSYEIELFGRKIKKSKTKYKDYAVIQDYEKKFNNFLTVRKNTYSEENVTYTKLNEKDAFNYYYNNYLEEIKKTLEPETEIVAIKNNFKAEGEKIRIWIELETLENGGIKQEIKKEEDYGENN